MKKATSIKLIWILITHVALALATLLIYLISLSIICNFTECYADGEISIVPPKVVERWYWIFVFGIIFFAIINVHFFMSRFMLDLMRRSGDSDYERRNILTLYRWLRPFLWDEVHEEVRRKFDIR